MSHSAISTPLIAVNHLEAHALTPRLTDNLAFPYCLFLASGQADALSGRYFRVEDDWAEMVRGADAIHHDDLYTLRLRTLQEPGGPTPPRTLPDH